MQTSAINYQPIATIRLHGQLSTSRCLSWLMPGVTKIAVLHRFEPGPVMAELLANNGAGRHHSGVPELRVFGVQVVVDVVQPHPYTPTRRTALFTFAQRFSDELSNLFEHTNTSPAVYWQVDCRSEEGCIGKRTV